MGGPRSGPPFCCASKNFSYVAKFVLSFCAFPVAMVVSMTTHEESALMSAAVATGDYLHHPALISVHHEPYSLNLSGAAITRI